MSAPSACPCRFCRERFQASGVRNHEKYCDENPRPGIHPDDAPELFDEQGARSSELEPDPDQSDTQPSGLPERQDLPREDNSGGSSTSDTQKPATGCPNCGSGDTLPSQRARQKFNEQMGGAPDELLATFDATERYCNSCFSVYGGDLPEPWPITEGFA